MIAQHELRDLAGRVHRQGVDDRDPARDFLVRHVRASPRDDVLRRRRPARGSDDERHGDLPEPLDQVGDADRDRRVSDLVSQLPEEERNVIRLRFGLSGDEPRTHRQTGSELGLTTDQVRKLEAKGLERLAGSAELEALRSAA